MEMVDVAPKRSGQRQAIVRRADDDDAARAGGRGQRRGQQSERPRALDGHRLVRRDAAEIVEGVHHRAEGAARQAGKVVRHVVGHADAAGLGQHIAIFGESAEQIRRPLHVLEHVGATVVAKRRLARDGAVVAMTAGGVGPHDAVAFAQRLTDAVALAAGAQPDDAPDHLVAENDRQVDLERQRTLPKMDVGAADRAGLGAHQQRAGLDFTRDRHLLDLQRLAEMAQHGGAGMAGQLAHARHGDVVGAAEPAGSRPFRLKLSFAVPRT